MITTMDARILRAVANRALDEARAAWSAARASPTETNVRAAMRACVLAARALRRAAPHSHGDASSMLAAAKRTDEAAAKFRDDLVTMAEKRPAVL